MGPPDYAPNRGDIIWLEFTPQAGHEQRGRRPALVLSPLAYNRKVGMALVCPITSHIKGYPFEVILPPELDAHGAVLCDQIKCLDWKSRKAQPLDTAPADVMEEVTARVIALLDPK